MATGDGAWQDQFERMVSSDGRTRAEREAIEKANAPQEPDAPREPEGPTWDNRDDEAVQLHILASQQRRRGRR